LPQPPQELRRIVAGSSRFHAFLELLESLISEVSDISIPLTPHDSLEVRQTMKKYLEGQLDLLRRIPQTRPAGNVAARRDDT
jgi:hypothetical protein